MASRAGCGNFDKVKWSAFSAVFSVCVSSSSFFPRKASGVSNMRLLIVVSIVKTLSSLFVTRPMRVTLSASALVFGSMYEWQSRMTFGLWCARKLR